MHSIVLTCLKCGHKFKPGNEQINPEASQLIWGLSIGAAILVLFLAFLAKLATQ
jgi:hypothetical protein